MRAGVVMAVLATAAIARADGGACTTTAECGELHCIDGRCVSLKEVASARLTTGQRGMFGDGKSYCTQMLVADLAALATVPLVVGVDYYGDGSIGHSNWGGYPFAMTAPVLAGPLFHFAHGRPIAGTISLLGWSSVAATSYFAGMTYGSATLSEQKPDALGNFDSPGIRGIPIGLAIAAVGGGLMTALDTWMARTVHETPHLQPPETSHSPSGTRAAGWVVLGIASAAATLALVGMVFIPGSCAACQGCGCSGGNWGWSVGGAIAAGVTTPIGIVLVLHREPRRDLSVGPASMSLTF